MVICSILKRMFRGKNIPRMWSFAEPEISIFQKPIIFVVQKECHGNKNYRNYNISKVNKILTINTRTARHPKESCTPHISGLQISGNLGTPTYFGGNVIFHYIYSHVRKFSLLYPNCNLRHQMINSFTNMSHKSGTHEMIASFCLSLYSTVHKTIVINDSYGLLS